MFLQLKNYMKWFFSDFLKYILEDNWSYMGIA